MKTVSEIHLFVLDLIYLSIGDGCQRASGLDIESLNRPFTIKLYGPVTQQYSDSLEKTNQTTEFAGLSPLRTLPNELFKVRIYSLKFSAAFAE